MGLHEDPSSMQGSPLSVLWLSRRGRHTSSTWTCAHHLGKAHKADKQLWTELVRKFTGAIVAATGANEPSFDQHILQLRNDPRVTMYLLPLPSFVKESKGQATSSGGTGNPSVEAGAKPQLKKKYKATEKAERSKPEALAGMETVTKDGQNVCWSFNMESEYQATLISGSKIAKCAKGLHVCAFCHKANHSQLVCNLKKRGTG